MRQGCGTEPCQSRFVRNKAVNEQTWLAVAVAAKGTLVADVVAADTVAGVAPCTMGTFGGKIT